MPNDTTPFAERLRMLRSKAAVTQEALAEVARCSQNAIGTWERGVSSPQVPELALLCDFFGVSADYMIGRSEFPTGLAPDSWVIDMDEVDDPTPNGTWCAKIPRRAKIVDYDGMRAIEESTQRKKQGTRKPKR